MENCKISNGSNKNNNLRKSIEECSEDYSEENGSDVCSVESY